MKGIIYTIINKINGKQYVGKTTKDPKKYWTWHKNCAQNGYKKVLYDAIRKYGEDNFRFQIVKTLDYNTYDKLNTRLSDLEIWYIKKYNSKVPNGYNLTDGGDGQAGYSIEFTEEHCKNISKACQGRTSNRKGVTLSKETRKKLSQAAMGKYEGKDNPFYGKTHDEETRKLISKKLSDGRLDGENNPFHGKSHTEETKKEISNKLKKISNKPEVKKSNKQNQPHRKEIKMYEKNTDKLIKEFISLSEASRWIKNNTKYKGDRTHFTTIYNKGETDAYGYHWIAK